MDDNLMEFVLLIQEWHKRKVQCIKDAIEAVETGTILKFNDDLDGEPMTAQQANFLKLGLHTALGEFEKLPFTVSENSDTNDSLVDE